MPQKKICQCLHIKTQYRKQIPKIEVTSQETWEKELAVQGAISKVFTEGLIFELDSDRCLGVSLVGKKKKN